MVASFVTVAVAAAVLGGADAPRFSLSATSLQTNDALTVRVVRPTRAGREIRLYLVPAAVAAGVRSRFDERVSYLGSVPSTRGARAVVTVPPLDSGRYALAYWCRGCHARRDGIGIQRAPALAFEAPSEGTCPATIPNENRPPGAPQGGGWVFHGNGRLWAVQRSRDGVLTTNSLGGHKQVWVGRIGAGAPLTVLYRPFGDASTPFTKASVVSGTLGGYSGTSWASRMSFQPGCWQIVGRQLDVTVSYVTQVVVPATP